MREAEELRYLILAAQREGNRLLAQGLRPLGLTPSQAEVIRVLSDRGSLTLNGLGELLVCDSGHSPSRLVDRMVIAGLLERRPSDRDRRYVELGLTSKGAKLAARITKIEGRLYSMLDAALAGNELDQITGFLRTLVAETPAGEALARRAGRSPQT